MNIVPFDTNTNGNMHPKTIVNDLKSKYHSNTEESINIFQRKFIEIY